MKKKLLLVTAAAMLLVACGGNNSTDYLAEPETKATVEKKDAAKNLTALSANVAKTNAFGVSVVADFSADIESGMKATKENELEKDMFTKYSFSAKDFKSEDAFTGLGTASMAASGSVSGKLAVNVEDTDVEYDDNLSASYKNVKRSAEANLNEKYYFEGGLAYFDFSNAVENFVKAFAPEGEASSMPKIAGKFKTTIPEQIYSTISSVPSLLSSFTASMAAELSVSGVGDIVASLGGSESASWTAALSFKSYTNGDYGMTGDIDVSKLLPAVGGDAAVVGGIEFGGVTGSLKIVAIYSENAFKSIGAKFSLKSDVPADEELGMYSKANIEGGFKVTFAYGDEVKVTKLSDADKAAYSSMSIPQEEGGDEGDDE